MTTQNWITGQSGDWSDAADWVSGVVPGSTDSAAIANSAVTVNGTAVADFLTLNASYLTVSGSLTLGTSLAVDSSSTLALSGGTLSAQSILSNDYGFLTGYGTASGAVSGDVDITAAGGTLKVQGSLAADQGNFTIDGGATLELSNGTAAPVLFDGTSATLKLDAPTAFTGSIKDIVLGDAIDLVGITASSASYSGTTLTVNETNGQQLIYNNVSGSVAGDTLTVASDNNGGTLVYWGSAPAVTTQNWITGQSGDWSDAADWVSGVVPGSTDSAAIANSAVTVNGTAVADFLTLNASYLTVSGSLTLGTSLAVDSSSTLALSGGTLSAQSILSNDYGFLTGYGTASGAVSGDVDITAAGGTLKVQGSLAADQGNFTIDGGATLELSNGTAAPVLFDGTSATLKLDAPTAFTGSIKDIVLGDAIDLVGITASSASYSGTTLTVNETNGQQLIYNNVSGSVAGDTLTVASDNNGGTLVYWTQPTTFTDNFSPPSPLWSNLIGNWTGGGGIYFAQAPGNNSLTYSGLPFDFTNSNLQVTVTVNGLSDGGIWLDSNGTANNGVLLVLGGEGYGGGNRSGGAGNSVYWALGTNIGEFDSTFYNEVQNVFTPLKTYTITVLVNGDTYEAFKDPDGVFDANSVLLTTLVNDAFSSGHVGLYDFDSAMSFSNFSVVGTLVTTPPTVTSIAATTDNKATDVNAGHLVTITMTTSEAVTVTGTPTLQLNDNEVATYTKGTGTNTLTFTYTVQPGDNISDLQVTGLYLPSGASIEDQATNALSGSVTGDLGIKINTTAPTISSIAAVTDNHATDVNTGHLITITVDTSEVVNVTGTPTLQLNDNEVATYTKGTGTNALTFTYTVQPGDNISDLQVTGLNLPSGATIQDVAGNNLSGSVTGDLGIQIDTTPPAVTERLFSDTGSSSTDKITSNDELTGSGDPNAVVHFTVDGKSIAATTTANGSGTWTFTPTGLADGVHTIVASETDAAGNTGSASLTFTLDTTAPVPVITSEVLSSGKVTLTGTTGEANDTIAVYDGTTLLGTNTTASNGAWSYTTGKASNVVHTYTETATDVAGNVGHSSNEAILGSTNADTLVGTSGNDIIIGNGGNDTITGGLGADTLTGGSGHVTFVYNSMADSTPSSHDTITDFNASRDIINFTNIAGINAHNGIATFEGKLTGPGNLTLNAHSVAYIEVNGNTEVLVNTTSTAETVTSANVSAANMEIVLVGIHLGLKSADFHHV